MTEEFKKTCTYFPLQELSRNKELRYKETEAGEKGEKQGETSDRISFFSNLRKWFSLRKSLPRLLSSSEKHRVKKRQHGRGAQGR